MGKVLKSIGAIFLATALVIGTGGCSKNNTNKTTSSTSNQPVSMRMMWWGGDTRHKATLSVIQQYQAKYPNVKIQGEYAGFDGYLEKLTTELAANTAPDIMQIDYAFMDQFSKESSMFVDLKTKKQLDLSGFDATLLKNLTFSSGKLIGVPTGLTNSTFYINQTLADQVGIDDSKQLTWDQLLEEGKKLHDAHSDMYLLNMTVNSDLHDYIFEPYLDNITGKQIVDNNYNLGFTQDQLVKALTYVSNLYTDNVVQPASQTAMIKSGQETTNPLWLNSKIVGLMYLNSMYTTISKSITGSKIAVVDFPSTHGTKNSGIISRPAQMWSINAQSKYSDEAAKFIDYMLIDTQAVKTEGLERSIPAVKSSRDTLLKDGVIDTFFSDSVTFSEKNPSLPQSFVSLDGEIQAIENDILSKVAYKQDTPQQGATEMMSQLKSKITELKASS